MPTQVLMPQFGESVNEGTITKWLKSKGDTVEEFEPLVEVNTDKVDTEVPSPASGVLSEILIPEGSLAQAGTLLAIIEPSGESPQPITLSPELNRDHPGATSTVIHPAAEISQPITSSSLPGRDRSLGFVSPLVARIAKEMKIDLNKVKGSGQGGRITKKDLMTYIERPFSEKDVVSPALDLSVPAPAPVSASEQVLPLTPVRRLIAEHMLLSRRTSPHVTTIMEADMSQVISHRQAHKETFARDGVNLTFTAYFAIATILALKTYPIVNSSWGEAGVILHPFIHLGIATSMGEAGLIVPVIKNAENLSLLGLAGAINDLSERARSRQLKPEEVQGGTFTITNHGVSGSLFATPIINQPQSAILGVGVIQKRPLVISDVKLGDVVAIRPMVYLGLTFDHRILDGVIADYFLGKVVETLQNYSP